MTTYMKRLHESDKLLIQGGGESRISCSLPSVASSLTWHCYIRRHRSHPVRPEPISGNQQRGKRPSYRYIRQTIYFVVLLPLSCCYWALTGNKDCVRGSLIMMMIYRLMAIFRQGSRSISGSFEANRIQFLYMLKFKNGFQAKSFGKSSNL